MGLVPSVPCPRYFLYIHLSLSHRHRRASTRAHTHAHTQARSIFFLPYLNISFGGHLLVPSPLFSESLCVYAKCPWQQKQTALIHHPRRGSIRWGEREVSASSLIFQLHIEGDDWPFWRRSNSQIIPIAVRLSKSEGHGYSMLAKINRVVQCCSGLTLCMSTWP